MKKALLDTNFIINCVKQKIDFMNDIRFMGYKIVIPEEVLGEIKNLENNGKKLHIRENAKLASKILREEDFEMIKLNDYSVDRGILNLSKEKKDYIVATIDKDLKFKIKRPILIIRGRKKIEMI